MGAGIEHCMEKPTRLLTLDAMRGLAAVVVLLFHLPDVGLAPSGYLAVDFFFMLSGFVIARTYDSRFAAGLPFSRFAALRAIRLYPLFLVGLALGVVRGVGQIVLDRPDQLGVGDLAISTVLEVFLLPSPVTDNIFPLNGPGWSLFFEMVISLIYGAVLVKASLRVLFAAAAASALLLVVSAVSHGSLEVGWAWAHLHGGVARVGFAFSVGMIIARLHRSGTRASAAALLPMFALVALLCFRPSDSARVAYDLIVAMVAAPALVWWGASLNPVRGLQRASEVLGELSYPVYAIHYPALWMFGFAARKAGVPAVVWMPLFLVGIVVAAWALNRYFDQPLRERLNRRARRVGAPAFARPLA